MKSPVIIGLTGPAGSGKDTVADLLVAQAGFVKLSFAYPLKIEVAFGFNIDVRFLEYRETKETPLACLALSRCLDEGFVTRMVAMHTAGGQRLDLNAPQSPRHIMQWWGTDYRRHQRADYWISKTHWTIDHLLSQRLAQRIVVTDIRFADEADLVRCAYAGQLWQVERESIGIAQGSHISETTGSTFRPDVAINNSHSVGHLQARVLEALEPGGKLVGVAA